VKESKLNGIREGATRMSGKTRTWLRGIVDDDVVTGKREGVKKRWDK